MRILLFTGKGGVGKTTTAAATAALAASSGLRTLVLSTDPAHSLGDALGVSLGGEPTEIAALLYGQQVDAQQRFEKSWAEISGYLSTLLDASGVDPLEAEELAVLPGAEEILALLEVRAQVLSGRFDVVIVDCAPTAETLRLLALPEALNWYMERVFPSGRRLTRVMRPVLTRVSGGMPMPRDSVFSAIERLHGDLKEVRAMLTDRDSASVRLVLTPEAVVVAEARRTLTSLSLYGYRVDAVIANRLMPSGGGDSWRESWVAAQSKQMQAVNESFAPLPILIGPYQPSEPVGIASLLEHAAMLYGDTDPVAVPTSREPMTVDRVSEGYDLRLALPLADPANVDLRRKGDDLVVTVGSHRRVLSLPVALRKCTISAANFSDGDLVVRFDAELAGLTR